MPPAAARFFDINETGQNVLIQIISAQGVVDEKLARLALTYGLTRTEARVVASVVSGKSSMETATAMEISMNTVKTHLKHCYDKIGVHSQVALMRLVSTF